MPPLLWPEFKLPPINLYLMPERAMYEYGDACPACGCLAYFGYISTNVKRCADCSHERPYYDDSARPYREGYTR